MNFKTAFCFLAAAVMCAAASVVPGGPGGGMPGGGMPGDGGGMPGDMGGMPGGMGGVFAYDSVLNVTTNADSTLSRGSLIYGFDTSPTAIQATSDISEIASGCFAGCATLTRVNLSKSSIVSVPSDCFAGCSSLKLVVLPSGCTRIESGAFAGCSALVSVIGGKVAEVGSDAFRDCVSLASAPTSADSVGVCAFANCSKLGTTGETDDTGATSEGANTGETGDAGATSDRENTGDTGFPSDTGSSRDRGSSGPSGDTGDTGSSGEVVAAVSGFFDDATPLIAAYATVYDGLVLDGAETIGRVRVKVGRASNRTGVAKISAAVVMLGRKKATYTGKVAVDGSGMATAILANGGGAMNVSVTGGSFTGEIDGFEIVGARNVSAKKEARAAEYARWVGTYDVALAATNAGGSGAAFAAGYSSLSVKVQSGGKVSVKGVMADGAKVSVSGLSLLFSADGTEACAVVVVPLYRQKLGGFGFQLWLRGDGSAAVTGISAWDASALASVGFIAQTECVDSASLSVPPNGTLLFSVDADAVPDTIGGFRVRKDLLPLAVRVASNGGKPAPEGKNPAKLSISRAVSTGLVSGRFVIYT